MSSPQLIDLVLSKDRQRLRRALREQPRRATALVELPEALRAKFEASIAERTARREKLPKPSFPEELPVSGRREEIAEAIRKHQVVIVCGETGSGKTTQLPKICLELGRGEAGFIGHTQPRRLAARATAARIAEELQSELGTLVGYKVRFTDHTKRESYIKLMTDGILLAETQGDPLLAAYDTLIIDEAHERSLNIDFLLGYLRQLLPKRPDLKVIVTSATLDAERFANHFATDGRPAPVIEVSGRLYPIEMRYRPIEAEDSGESEPARARPQPFPRGRGKGASSGVAADVLEGICDAVAELQREGPGDVLVFLPGEREIREAAEALRKNHPPGAEILPLFARQTAAEQARVFSRSNGRRVVLSTNVAETSLTVPGIRYVVDTGLARVNRYSHRNKVELLQIEKIAQSAAKQRAGRCGRVQNGICIRLYDEEDFERRPAHTDPEILRSSLAGVILRMKSLRLGEVEAFPFIEPPLPRMIADGYQLLQELGAVAEAAAPTPGPSPASRGGERRSASAGSGGDLRGASDRNPPPLAGEGRVGATRENRLELTAIGRELAKLPLDPKIGRMILAARDRGALAEVLVIAAALSVQDPRERPQEQSGTADQAHARFRSAPDAKDEPRSEFLWYWNLWCAFDKVWKHESSSKQKAWCKQHFLNWMRMREWRDIHGQLHALCAEHGWKESTERASYEAIHKALLTGLLGHIGCKVEDASGPAAGSYQGARGIKFWPHPGSYLKKNAGKWLMAAELIDTSRLYARCIARIEPEWIEEVGAHLVKKSVYEPHWEKRFGAVRAWERGVLHGITLYPRRAVGYSDIDPKLCRELLIRDGLVQGEIDEAALKQMGFLTHNQRLMAEIERLEHKTRRPDVLVDDQLIYAFYDAQVPENVTDLRAFEAWRKGAEKGNAKRLFLVREQLMRHEAAGASSDKFPAGFEVLGQKLKLTYLHQPNDAEDGVTLTVPLAMLNQVPLARCEWLVPGLLEEKVTALLKTVPQKHRHRLQPIGQSAKEFIEAADAGEFSREDGLVRALQKFVEDKVSLKLPQESFRLENLNPHCFMNFRVIDEHGRVLGMSRNLPELRTRLRDQVQAAFRSAQVPGSLGAQLAALKVGGRTEAPVDVNVSAAAHGNPPPQAGEGRVGAGRSAALDLPPPRAQSRPAASPLGRRGVVLPETPPSPPASGGGSRNAARVDAAKGARADTAKSGMRADPGSAGASAQEKESTAPMSGLTAWTFGELPELLEVKVAGRTVIGFPALHDDGDSVSITAVDTEEEAARTHRKGLARLFALALKDQMKAIEKLPGIRELALQFMPFGTDAELKAQLVAATLERTCLMEPLPANAEAFAQRAQDAKARISLVAQELMRLAGALIAEHASLMKRFATLKQTPDVLADLQQQLQRLMPKNFLLAYPFEKLSQFPRYLKAMGVRIDKLRNNVARDAQLMADWKSLAQPFERELIAAARAGVIDPQLEEFRWLLEELRVGLFAQELKTPMPVSVKRLQKIWDSRPR